MPRDFDTKPAIFSFMQKHVGVIYTIQDIADEFHIDRHKAMQHLSSLANRDGLIVTHQKGMYVFKGISEKDQPKIPTKQLYEYLGTTQQFGDIIRGEDGVLYRIEKL